MLCVLGAVSPGIYGISGEAAKKLFICAALWNLDRNVPIL
jgi:hypothetical protein